MEEGAPIPLNLGSTPDSLIQVWNLAFIRAIPQVSVLNRLLNFVNAGYSGKRTSGFVFQRINVLLLIMLSC